MKKRENVFRKYCAIVLMMVYAFAFFSQQFHHHEIGISSDKQISSKYKNLDHENSKKDCLACHFLTTGHTILPDKFDFYFTALATETQLVFQQQEKIWSATKFSYQLRGPPLIS